jgi:ankyrin repeat protein
MAKTVDQLQKQDYTDTLFRCTKNNSQVKQENLKKFEFVCDEAKEELPATHHINLEEKNRLGETFLLSAVGNENYPIAEYLIEAKADVKAVNKKDENILHLAAKRKAEDFINSLVNKNLITNYESDPVRIFIDDKDSHGYTALNIADTVNAPGVIKILTELFPSMDKSEPEHDVFDSSKFTRDQIETLKSSLISVHESAEGHEVTIFHNPQTDTFAIIDENLTGLDSGFGNTQ